MANQWNEYYKYIQETIPLVEVFGCLGIKVVGGGARSIALCPFHNDTHPSLHLYEQNYHCFACGAHGDIFSIVEKNNNCDFRTAVGWLEDNFPGICSERPKLKKVKPTTEVILPFELARKHFSTVVDGDKEKFEDFATLRHYAVSELRAAEVYFTDGNKLSDLAQKDRAQVDLLQSKNLIFPRKIAEGKENVAAAYRDAFCTPRVVFTLRNSSHEIVGFAGRSCDDEIGPKYLFTKGLAKKDLLYRLDHVSQSCIIEESATKGQQQKEICTLYLVEGLFDALRLEQCGLKAVAVLGSQVANGQILVLEEFVKARRNAGRTVILSLFLDSDTAGIEGAYRSIRSIWKSPLLRNCLLTVTVNSDFCLPESVNPEKDPDAIFFGKSHEENSAWIESHTFHGLEFLMRYFADRDSHLCVGLGLEDYFQTRLEFSDRVQLLNDIGNLFSNEGWNDILETNQGYPSDDNEVFAITVFRKFFQNERWEAESATAVSIQGRSAAQQYELALQVAKTSYMREEVPLDVATWDRIQYTGDVIFPYFNGIHRYSEALRKCGHLKIPMLAFNMPKDDEKNRLKALPAHESLILQQYLLNELLSEDAFSGYAKLVPAVRYSLAAPNDIYTTGCGFTDFFQKSSSKAVSFAYQIDMSVISGAKIATDGMFRPFYDCWKSFIAYLQEGIEAIDAEQIFRVKLDIKGYYENILRTNVRDAFVHPLAEALVTCQSKFSNWNLPDSKQKKSEALTDYILEELFGNSYINPKTGEIAQAPSIIQGIPQGPNLSAYVANVLLFELDKAVSVYVDEVNNDCEQGFIKVRYGRYVDDMVIISADYEALLEIEHIVIQNLQKLSLELSPKTDDANAIIKEDAQWWLLDEKGGLGASEAGVIPEDAVDAVLYGDYEQYSVDRRSALKILNSGAEILKIDDTEHFEDALYAFFKTENVRYGDIIRLAEFILRFILQNRDSEQAEQKTLYSEYDNWWQKGVKERPQTPSMLMREDVVTLSFLDGIIRILNQKISFALPQTEQQLQEKIQKELHKCLMLDGFFEEVISIRDAGNLKDNSSFVNLKILQIAEGLLGRAESKARETITSNYNPLISKILADRDIYLQRWAYALNRFSELNCIPSDFSSIPQDDKDWLETYYFFTEKIMQCDSIKSYDDIASLFNESYGRLKLSEKNQLIMCMQLWFLAQYESDDVPDTEGKLTASALSVLCNLLKRDLLAQVLGKNHLFCECLFDQQNKWDYIPIPPSVSYPGIFAIAPSKNEVQLIDFSNSAEDFSAHIEPREGWTQAGAQDCCVWKKYSMEFTSDWKCISEQVSLNSGLTDDTIKLIISLFGKISMMLDKRQGLILSKYHLFVDDAGELHSLSYQIAPEGIPAGVAVSGGGSALKWKTVVEQCKEYGIASAILSDVLNLNQYSPVAEDYGVKEILSYSLPRLSGTWGNKALEVKGEQSIKRTVEKTLKALTRFAETESPNKPFYLLELYLTDALMSSRLDRSRYALQVGEEAKFLCEIAKGAFLRQHARFGSLMTTMFVGDSPQRLPCRRVSAMWMRLGMILQVHLPVDEALQTTRLLCSAFFIKAISANLQMQVLERVWCLSESELELLSKRELPVDFLNASEAVLLQAAYDDEQKRIKELMQMYRKTKDSKEIENITPICWLVLLCWVLEIQSQMEFCTHLRLSGISPKKNWDTLEAQLKQLGDLLLLHEETSAEFPYEGLLGYCESWNTTSAQEMLDVLNEIDRMNGFKIVTLSSPLFGFHSLDVRMNTKVAITLETATTNTYPAHFLTFIGTERGLVQHEQKDGGSVWTQTVCDGKVLGISAISDGASNLLWAKDEVLSNFSETQIDSVNAVQEDILPSSTHLRNGIKVPDAFSKADALTSDNQSPKTKAELSTHKVEEKSQEIDKDFRKTVNFIHDKQIDNWKERKSIVCIDRIALFQFDVDDSYVHPISEACLKQRVDTIDGETSSISTTEEIRSAKANPALWNAEKIGQYGNQLYSCAEFRRRKLLEKVFEACNEFTVEILLLPEYSVRPETVAWMVAYIEKFDYKFSVWAGTCRLPVGRKCTGGLEKLNKPQYDYTAVLPIFCNAWREGSKGERDSELILDRFKKFPALSLQEVINPTQQTRLDSAMKTSCSGGFFGDARDDVTELICAEVFLASNPSNVGAFAKVYGELCRRFGGKLRTQEDLHKETLQDLLMIGKRTALMQMKKHFEQNNHPYDGNGKYGQTPIILTPAYTSRAVDYYVSGQAGYLASGLTTVFCNAVGMNTIGGSCFIGTDCWDNHNGSTNAYLPNYSLYHGAFPGVYHQFDKEKAHGALGDHEQALVICDINPMALNAKPTPESMQQPLALVAHLPIVESCAYKSREGYRQCRCGRLNGVNVDALEAIKEIDSIIKIKSTLNTSDDIKPNRIYEALMKLGKAIKSPGMEQRAAFYLAQHRNNPQVFPPPTLLDWIWVEIDYLSGEPIPTIDMPAFCNADGQDMTTNSQQIHDLK